MSQVNPYAETCTAVAAIAASLPGNLLSKSLMGRFRDVMRALNYAAKRFAAADAAAAKAAAKADNKAAKKAALAAKLAKLQAQLDAFDADTATS